MGDDAQRERSFAITEAVALRAFLL